MYINIYEYNIVCIYAKQVGDDAFAKIYIKFRRALAPSGNFIEFVVAYYCYYDVCSMCIYALCYAIYCMFNILRIICRGPAATTTTKTIHFAAPQHIMLCWGLDMSGSEEVKRELMLMPDKMGFCVDFDGDYIFIWRISYRARAYLYCNGRIRGKQSIKNQIDRKFVFEEFFFLLI